MFQTTFSAVRSSALRGSVAQTRSLHVTQIRSKTLVDSVKETADAINKKTGQALASGIDKTEQAAGVVSEKAGEASEVASEKSGEVKQKANQATADAKKSAQDLKEDIKK